MRPSPGMIAAASILAVVLAAEASPARKDKRPRTEDIINIYLGIEHSQWLVGPIYYMASPEEREAFLALRTDEEAEGFIEEFWKRQDPEPEIFGNPVLDLFVERAEVADRRYREQAVIGRRTDRGALFVLFGEPELIRFDTSPNPAEPDLEIWSYTKKSQGLSGVQPKSRYYFAEKDGRTVLHSPRASRLKALRQ